MAKRQKRREIPLTTFRDDKTGIEIATHSNDRPTREALRQGQFEKNWTVGREYGTGFRRVDSIETLVRNGTLTPDHARVAARFRANFARAKLDTIATTRLDPTPRAAGKGDQLHRAETITNAKDRIAADVDWVGGHGSPMGDALWNVVGLELSAEQYARRASWGGRALSTRAIVGLLIGALDLLDRRRLPGAQGLRPAPRSSRPTL